MAKLRIDSALKAVQVFAPKKIVAITAGASWEPDDNDIAYCVPEDSGYTIDGGDTGSLLGGLPRGINKDSVYVFATTMNIEVM